MLALQALANLHQKMRSHGDLKPDNIIVDINTEGCPAILIDFALAGFYSRPARCVQLTSARLANAQSAHVQRLKWRALKLLQASCLANCLYSFTLPITERLTPT